MKLDTEAVRTVAKSISGEADEIVHSPYVPGSNYGGDNMEDESKVALRKMAPKYADVFPEFGQLAQSVSPHIKNSLAHLSKAVKVFADRLDTFVTAVVAADTMGDEHSAKTLRETWRHP